MNWVKNCQKLLCNVFNWIQKYFSLSQNSAAALVINFELLHDSIVHLKLPQSRKNSAKKSQS